ncbi:MAG: hypothetical protein ACOYMA_12255 [Bacteroidia bacterium]
MCSQIESNDTNCCSKKDPISEMYLISIKDIVFEENGTFKIRPNSDLGLPEFSVRKQRKLNVYKKSQSIKDFEVQYQEWYYKDRIFDKPMQVQAKFSDKGSNDLTKLIKAWFEVNGGFAQRVNSGATFDPRLGIFRKGSGSTVGAADIMATFKGKAIHIEVKIGKDKQRKEQKAFQEHVQSAGGIYFIAKSYDNFLEQINKLSL